MTKTDKLLSLVIVQLVYERPGAFEIICNSKSFVYRRLTFQYLFGIVKKLWVSPCVAGTVVVRLVVARNVALALWF